jgi:CheY-like chemotaxis protein
MASSRACEYDRVVVPSNLAGRVVLIVDDDPVLLELMAGAFDAVGARVHTARLLVEAQREIAEHRPDIVISDVNLADGTAIELITWLRSLSVAQGRRTPCVAITGHPSFHAPAAAAGFQAALHKPVDLSEVCRVANAVLARSSAPPD